MGTKSTYIKCIDCGKLSPSPGYFYRKGFLSERTKKKCIWCLEKMKKYRIKV